MPAAPAAPPPATAPAPTQPQQAAKTTINVSELPKPTEPIQPPKPGSARARLMAEMQQKFSGESAAPATAAPPAPAPVSGTPPAQESPGAEPPAGSAPTPPEKPEPAPPEAGKATKKVSPWKLVDQFKERATQAEAKIVELEKQLGPESERQASAQKLQSLEQKVKEMTDDLRFYNAEKYDPDIIKANSDYIAAWKKAVKELSEITVTDPATGQPRAANADDLAELMHMSLGQARKVAEEAFGSFADDVMAHRKSIRDLLDAKAEKLEELKKTGAERDQQRETQARTQQEALQKFVAETYTKANADAAAHEKHGVYFRPREGNTDADKAWNQALEKGYKLVDEALSQNPTSPNLSPNQRAEIIYKHAAIRNRAASWGPLRVENQRLLGVISGLEKELKAFRESQPTTAGRAAQPAPAKVSGMAGLRSELEKIAKSS